MDRSYSLAEVQEHLFTAVLSDVLDAQGCFGHVAEPGLSPLDPSLRMAGLAATARVASVNRVPEEPYARLLKAIDALTPDDVLVISTDARSHSAIFGGLLATAVSVSGGRGAVIDGFARDANEILALGLPTVARGLVPLDSYGRDEVVEIGGPITVAGVPVLPGDLVFADRDGLVIVPARLIDDTLTRAFEKVSTEGDVRRALRGGMPTAEAFERFGVL